MKYANTPFPDEQARKHYQALRSKLADFPQNPAGNVAYSWFWRERSNAWSTGWAAQRASLEKDVDEMARLAAKKEDEHHHHEEGMTVYSRLYLHALSPIRLQAMTNTYHLLKSLNRNMA